MRYVSHIILIALFFAFVYVFSSYAEERYTWQYIYTIDGDSLVFAAPWNPSPLPKTVIIRLDGIDSPERHAQCEAERVQARKAKEFVLEQMSKAKKIEVAPLAFDKFGGRILSKVYVDGENLSEKILKAGLAREYHGEKKKAWC